MGTHGTSGDGNSSNSDDTSEKRSNNEVGELHAENGDGTLRINEDGSTVSFKNNSTHGRRPNDHQGPQAKKKYLHRLTSLQSQILEGFFSICAHPDDNQRKQLSRTTGLGEHQVKFWFQNKRTQVKHLSGKEENYRLKVENEMLRDETSKLKQATAQRNNLCPRCTNDPAHLQLLKDLEQLKAHNQWLQHELQLARLNAEIRIGSPSCAFHLESSENVFTMQDDRQVLAEIAKNALQELVILADSEGPLWLGVPSGSFETINKIAYAQTCPGQISAGAIGLKTEGTRANAVVMLDPKSIVEFLMDAESYGTFFSGLMSGATTTKVYNWPADRNAGYDGAMQLLTVELVYPSPLVPARKCTFLRYCKKLELGAMAVVDVSLEDGEGTFSKCRKMPSGVLIQPIRHNSCKVTVIEHVRVDDSGVHELFQPCMSGLLFGARRWAITMARQSARIRDVYHVTACSLNVSSMGRKIIMKLADNLLANYASSIAAMPADAWTLQRGDGTEDDIKIVYRRTNDGSNTAIVCASVSFSLQLPMRRVFDLLKNNLLRVKWDVLVNGGSVKEEVRVANGVGSDDAVSILHVKHGNGANKETTMIIQNSCYDASGSFMVFSSLDKKVLEMITSPGSDEAISNIALFPTGFYLVPTADPAQGGSATGETGGTLITAGYQILMKLARGTGLCPRSVSSAAKIMTDNIEIIKDTLINSHPVFYKRIPPNI